MMKEELERIVETTKLEIYQLKEQLGSTGREGAVG